MRLLVFAVSTYCEQLKGELNLKLFEKQENQQGESHE